MASTSRIQAPITSIAWNANQKIYDLREDWWAIKAGLMQDPAVKRVVLVNISNVQMDTVAQRLVNNEFDSSLDMRAQTIGNILQQNPKVQSWTGNKPRPLAISTGGRTRCG